LRGARLLGLAGILFACGRQSKSTAASGIPAPEVEYDGCWAVSFPGPVCALKDEGQITLWVRNISGLKVQIRAGDQIVKARGQGIAGGRRFALTSRPEGSLLKVRLCRSDEACGPPWSLTLAPSGVPKWFKDVGKLRSSDQQRRLEQLRKIAPSREQGFVLRSLAVLAEQNPEQERIYLEQGIAADRAVSDLKGEVEKVTWLARLDILHDRLNDARQTLENLRPRLPPATPAVAKYQVAFYQGLLGERVGDYRSALEQLRQAADLAERVLRPEFQWKAEQVLAGVLQEIGRSKEASGMFASLRAHPLDPHQPCDLGDLLNNEGWSLLLAHEAGEKAKDPTPLLEEARSEFDAPKHQCSDEKRLNVRLNLALADQQAGRWREAGQALEEAHALASKATPHLRLWWLDLEAREVIKTQPMHALELYDELAREAERSLSLEGRFRAEFGRAQAHLALGPGHRKAAIADLAEADDLIDEESRHVPASEGRDNLVEQRETATKKHLELLLADDQQKNALDLVRRDRSRLLRQLAFRDRLTQLRPEEKQKWDRALSRYQALRKSIDAEAAHNWDVPPDQIDLTKKTYASRLTQAQHELDHAVADLGDFGDHAKISLSPPGEGEVILAYHPLPKGGWVGFAAHGRHVEVHRFQMDADPPTDPKVLAELLLVPFQKAIAQAGRVRMLSYGSLRAVDFDALPFGDEPLFARHLVVYSLDLPMRPTRPSSAATTGKAVALLVSNPLTDQGYLAAAHEEAKVISQAVGEWGHGWRLMPLEAEGASSKAVSAALPGADLFHFAGHGNFAGLGGWDSALPLADDSRLTLGDILTLRRVPRWVVLSACDAGHSSEQAPGEGIGLANAFLLAGSQEVIASTRTVDDETARYLMTELYRGWKPGTDLAPQLQRAELACRQEYPQADCTSFRLLQP
jgi:hypothetical protein